MANKSIPLALLLCACSAHALDAAQFMDNLTWEKRVLVIFAPHAADSDLQLQNTTLADEEDGLVERHMTVIRVLADDRVSIDGRPQGDHASNFHEHFGAAPERFRVLLIGKDGGVKLDRDAPVGTGELFMLIDSMPMRRQEMLRNG